MATPTLDRPAPTPDNSRNRRFGKGTQFIAALLGAGAIGLFAHQALDNDDSRSTAIQEQVDESYADAMAERGHDVTNGNPIVIENGTEAITVQYPTTIEAQGDIRDKLDIHSKNFDTWRQDTLDILNKKNLLTNEQSQYLKQNLDSLSAKSNKSDYTIDEILTAVHLDIADATMQDDGTDGAGMLSVVYGKSNANYSRIESIAAQNTPEAVIEAWGTGGYAVYDRPKDHYFQGEDFGQVKDARIIVRYKIPGPGQAGAETKRDVSVYVLHDAGNGNEQWQLHKSYDFDSPSVNAELETLHPQR